uniref:Uncharacterized protein n=1 Tax=Plectus sambesii TaxID=2011161 RepID=A0A914WK39_9BILA
MPRDQQRASPRASSSDQIKQEIQRFESVHPCIYAVYDLVDLVPDPLLAQQIRDHVVCIEDAFVNSQEWTLSHTVPELKLGVVGSLNSGKSALVHRYLTGSYMQEESPEGGRFKKEFVNEDQSYLLLIRDEGGHPEQQFWHWVDAVILVFSVEDESSFAACYNYYAKMAHHRNMSDVPLILVGTQDAISESNPRVIDENRARKLANDLKRCSYYETCATYGLNVERVFRDAGHKIIQQRMLRGANGITTRTPTPTTPALSTSSGERRFQMAEHQQSTNSLHHQPQSGSSSHQRSSSVLPMHDQQSSASVVRRQFGGGNGSPNRGSAVLGENKSSISTARYDRSSSALFAVPAPPPITPQTPLRDMGVSPAASSNSISSAISNTVSGSTPSRLDLLQVETFDNHIPVHPPATSSSSQLPTPSSTPTVQRKNRRISNIFQRQGHNKESSEEKHRANGEPSTIGVGRAIPIKQGHLYKRSSKTLNKEWKKKYVCLYADGRLSYHSNLKDYMEKDAHAKEVFLGLATVKVPGRQRPRVTQRAQTQPITVPPYALMKENNSYSGIQTAKRESTVDLNGQKVMLTAYEFIQEGKEGASTSSDLDGHSATSRLSDVIANSQVKKRRGHRRLGSGVKNADNEEEDNDFIIVSCDQKRWEFSAANADERDEWVVAIEEQIEKALQAQLSQKHRQSKRQHGDKAEVQALRQLPGNDRCADCDATNPDWASLNLGTLICIECSGIHRNLGSHISRVRSLELDEWPIEYIAVMQAIGNDFANRLWEQNVKSDRRPSADSDREVKEAWIKAKYERKIFLPDIPSNKPMDRLLIEAVLARDLGALLLVLPRCSESDVNAHLSINDLRTPLHLACLVGSPELTQLLIWYNADLRSVNEEGCSAIWFAKQGGSQDCYDILINAGLDPNFGLSPNADTFSSLRQKSTVQSKFVDSAQQRQQNGRTSDAFDKLPSSII